MFVCVNHHVQVTLLLKTINTFSFVVVSFECQPMSALLDYIDNVRLLTIRFIIVRAFSTTFHVVNSYCVKPQQPGVEIQHGCSKV